MSYQDYTLKQLLEYFRELSFDIKDKEVIVFTLNGQELKRLSNKQFELQCADLKQ